MSELSREQVEALDAAMCPDCGHGASWHHGPGECDFDDCECSRAFGQSLAPTVAAMLDEARAEVVRDVATEVASTGSATQRLANIVTILERYASDAAGAPQEPRGASERGGGPSESVRPGDGRTSLRSFTPLRTRSVGHEGPTVAPSAECVERSAPPCMATTCVAR